MTSRHPLRAKKLPGLHKVPPLELVNPSLSARESGSRSAPGGLNTARPRCPTCGHGSKVFRWYYWQEQSERIYVCAQSEHDTETVCGTRWIESRRIPRCPLSSCNTLLRIVENGWDKRGVPVHMYFCTSCGDHSM